jgi:HTH-type transcriptional regulator/antitoxin HigA
MLSSAFTTSADMWLNLQIDYDKYQEKIMHINALEETIKRKAEIQKFPIAEMIKRELICDSENIDIKEEYISHFFNVENISQIPNISYAARKNNYTYTSYAQMVWVKEAMNLAQSLNVPLYNKNNFEKALPEIKNYREDPHDICSVINFYLNHGIKIIAIKPYKNMKMQAALFWENNVTPVIALTLLYDRLDNFWFNLLHETCHIIYEDAKGDTILEGKDNYEGEKPDYEIRADKFANDFIIDDERFKENFEKCHFQNYKEGIVKIRRFAKEYKLHESLVTGRLKHFQIIPYNMYSNDKKINDIVLNCIKNEGFNF